MSTWQDILSVAIHTPSPHNVQPWKLRIVTESEADLYVDSTRTLPKEDVTGSFIISAMWMFVEAIDILAENRGFRLLVEELTEPDAIAPAILQAAEPTMIPFARLRLTPDDNNENLFDEDLFLKRRTSRLHLSESLPPENSVEALSLIGKAFGQLFSMTTDKARIERILALNTTALFEDLNSRDYHDEIVEWFRYTDRQSRKHLDGLDARCMNTSPINYWLVANAPMLLKLPVAKQVMSAVYRRQIGPVPALGVISGKFWEASASSQAGRFLMRFWLETARYDLYLHPYGNLVTNRKAAQELERELGVENIWLVFKIGHSDIPPKSRRLPVEKILI